MIADDGLLDTPSDMGECGQTDLADVTQSLFPNLRGIEVTDVEALAWQGRRVGVKLNVTRGEPFHFWVDGDELYWGDEASLVSHEWLGGITPKVSKRIEI